MVIARGNLDRGSLVGQVVIVTGGGGGIGYEAARSLLWLGASVVIGELDGAAAAAAERTLAAEWGAGRVSALQADVSDEESVCSLVAAASGRFGRVDAVLNNAAYAPVGATVAETSIERWDRSYAVNLRGPVLLARACLPAMIARGRGVFVCVSSTGGPYLGAYEALKAAQLAMANTLDGELEGTGVIAFTIGPGLIPTPTAAAAIELIAPKLGTTVEEFWKANAGAVLSVEEAGAGFAAAIALACRYGGQEISSSQALVDAGIQPAGHAQETAGAASTPSELDARRAAAERVRITLREQAAGWQQRSFFERQWMLRDYKQRVGAPVERCLETLDLVVEGLAAGDGSRLEAALPLLERLGEFYEHLGKLAEGYVKDPAQRAEQMELVRRWAGEVAELTASAHVQVTVS